MGRTFDDLVRTALVDIASQAEPPDLSDAALRDAARRRRAVGFAAVTAVVLSLGLALLAGIASGGDGPRIRPVNRLPAPDPVDSTVRGGCAQAPAPECAGRSEPGDVSASAGPSPTRSKSPTSERSAEPSPTDDHPGNRPRPKPSRPGKGTG